MDRQAGREPPPEPARIPCTGTDPELFFAESNAVLQLAKQVCAPCPVRTRCLAGALARREPWGVWGGQLLADGEVVGAKRPRGRPRKHLVA